MSRDKMRDAVESKAFQTFIFCIIIANAISIGFETKPASESVADMLELFDIACLTIYIIEAGMKIYAYGRGYFKDRWNLFDFCIIAVSLVPSRFIPLPVQILRVIRVFRAVRVFRLVSMFRQMRVVVESIVHSVPGVLWTFALMMVFVYVFDVAGVFLFGEKCPDQFGDLPTGLWSLFQIVTLEGWPDIAHGVMSQYPHSWLYFVPFIILTSFIMVNIVLGIILNTIEESRQSGRVEPGSTEAQLAQELEDLRLQIETVQRLLDKSNSESGSK